LVLKFSQITVPQWFSSYFADALCLPLMLSYLLLWIRRVKKTATFKLTPTMIFTAWLMVSLVFEWFAPSYSKRYTADMMDVAVYAFGGIAYWFCQEKNVFF
jgi:hypothetical protein